MRCSDIASIAHWAFQVKGLHEISREKVWSWFNQWNLRLMSRLRHSSWGDQPLSLTCRYWRKCSSRSWVLLWRGQVDHRTSRHGWNDCGNLDNCIMILCHPIAYWRIYLCRKCTPVLFGLLIAWSCCLGTMPVEDVPHLYQEHLRWAALNQSTRNNDVLGVLSTHVCDSAVQILSLHNLNVTFNYIVIRWPPWW